jgi:hypothetical protein
MVMHPSGIFDYVFTVPEGPKSYSRHMMGVLRYRTDLGDCLVGQAPTLETADDQRQPWQLFSRVTLAASDKRNARVASVWFTVDRELIAVLRGGDSVNISRTGCGGVGVSIIRNRQLVAAVGAIANVPLGANVTASLPWGLLQKAEAIFRTRDPNYTMPECPLEITVSGSTRILSAGRPTIGEYEVFVRHGFIVGTPGTDECVSISRRGVCPDTAAHTSAQLIDAEGLTITS